MELDLVGPIKQALAKAKDLRESGHYPKAATFYEKAASLMSLYADQAISREHELSRRQRAIEYRELAKKLRAGEVSTPSNSLDRSEKKEPATATGASNEIRSIVANLMHTSQITWNDIGGLEQTKDEIKFALGMTLAVHPPGVTIAAWTKILFYGPPGTGKTLLAAATSNAVKSGEGVPSVFYNVKISNILSKYFGESSKIVDELYGTARDTSPSVIFLDEFEALAGQRDAGDSGAERRILSTLLSELDGMDAKGQKLYVLTIAATNRPWDLDPAVLSRFEKKILIPLPDAAARQEILKIHLDRRGFTYDVPLIDLAEMTDGFSGRELERFCKEVTTGMIEEMNRDITALVDRGLDQVKKYRIKVRPLTWKDFEEAARLIHPQTTKEEMRRYLSWKERAEEV